MQTSERRPRAAVLRKIGHFLTALVVILKGVAKLEHPEGYWPLIAFLFAGGIYIAIVTLLHDRLHRHTRRIEASVYAIECLVMVAVSWIFVSEGRHAIQYLTGLAAVAFAFAVAMRLFARERDGGHEHAPADAASASAAVAESGSTPREAHEPEPRRADPLPIVEPAGSEPTA